MSEDERQRSGNEAAADAPELQTGDFYLEGPYTVFTEQYLLRRGYCCHSGCRHCPYGESG